MHGPTPRSREVPVWRKLGGHKYAASYQTARATLRRVAPHVWVWRVTTDQSIAVDNGDEITRDKAMSAITRAMCNAVH